jgi:hypothetical protein
MGRTRSYSPAAVDLDFSALLDGKLDVDGNSLEVIAYDESGHPLVFDGSRPGKERHLVPHRLDRLFGAATCTLSLVMRDERCTRFAAYFDAVGTQPGPEPRNPGLIGDGDWFHEQYGQRAIAASHFDQFADFDGDGDLDLFQGGVEPYVFCNENVGGNRLVERGRLASANNVLKLPHSAANRSWVTVAFFDIDGDGDQDFFPSFNDGPETGRIVFYRNTTARPPGPLNFERVGIVRTISGEPLAGGSQAGGWFPSILFVWDWDGAARGRLDAIVGSNHGCWLYRGRGVHEDGSPSFAAAVPIQAGGADIQLVNPRYFAEDVDGDGDLDLFAGSQPGPVWWFPNVGTRFEPVLAAGQTVAFRGRYLIGDAHSGVHVADVDGDGRPDILAGRFWERTNLDEPVGPREFGGCFRNVGPPSAPRFVRSAAGSPYLEDCLRCDAVRQNGVRAVDWDRDGRRDLLAGDTDGFIWLFRNESSRLFPLFARPVRILAGGAPLSLAASGGHARFDVCDWNRDGSADLLVADGQGTLTLFPSAGPGLALVPGERVLAGGRPVQGASRASVLVGDWNQDGLSDVVFADEKGFYWHRNVGTEASPVLAVGVPILFGGRPVRYVRPNLGSLVDWDGDGRRDLIGCHFENSVRWYRNLGGGTPGEEPRFDDPEGVTILKASSPQMISGADVIDWNGDGDLDLLTGQGHGGSGLRYYERDWIEDELRGTHPRARVGSLERKH